MKELDSFTVERLEEFIRQPLENGLTRSEQMELARIALAAKRAEESHSRREVWDGGNTWIQCSRQAYDRHEAAGKRVRVLYERPQLNSPEIPEGWTSSDPANAALVMLDRIDTIDSADDDRIEDIKLIIRQLAAAPEKPL